MEAQAHASTSSSSARSGMELHHGGVLRDAADHAARRDRRRGRRARRRARAWPVEGRFPILRRISGTAVVPREQGVEGWLWTSIGGSAFPTLCDEDEAPNGALAVRPSARRGHRQPLLRARVRRGAGRPLAARRARRSTACSCASATCCARRTRFRKFNVANPLTDTRGRADAASRAADRRLRRPDGAVLRRRPRASRSVAPPGLALASLPSGAEPAAPDRAADPQACRPCRGTGQVISNLGGSPSTVTCPWCEGTGAA